MTAVALCIHSTGTPPLMWDGLPREAFGEVALLTPSNLGYPPHPPLLKPGPFVLEDEVRHLLGQLPDGAAVHLLAHSYGGLVALRLLPRLGARVKSVLLFEPVLFGALTRSTTADADAVAQAKSFLGATSFLDEAQGGDEAWLRTFIDYWNRPGSWDRMPEPMQAFARAMSWKMFREVSQVFLEPSRFEDHQVRAPLTLLKAERSPVAARAMVDELKRVNPHAVVRELVGTGHMAPLTHPPLFVDAVLEHWARVKRLTA